MGTAYIPLSVGAAVLGTTNMPELVLVQTTPATPTPAYMGYAFDATTNESIYFLVKIRNYTSTPILTLDWYAASATSNNCIWGCQIAAYTPGDAGALSAKTLATAQTTTTAAPATTAGRVATTAITITNLDSLADGDDVLIRVYRDAASDNMTGDAILIAADLTYTTP